MSSERTNLRHQHQTEQVSSQGHFHETASQSQTKEFAAVEDLLRFDSEQNPVPPEVADRLGRSLAAEPKPEKPWYRKLFGN